MTLGSEFARKIRNPEHFTDLMTNTAKNSEENKRTEALCNLILMKYQINEAMEIITKTFFEEDFPCFSPKRDDDSHSIFFKLHGIDFQVIKGLNYKTMKKEGESVEKTLYYNPITLKVDGEDKLKMRFLNKKTYLGIDNKVQEIEINELERFNVKYDSACFKPAEWVYTLCFFYNKFSLLIILFEKHGKICSELSELSEKESEYLEKISKNIQIDPEILREFT